MALHVFGVTTEPVHDEVAATCIYLRRLFGNILISTKMGASASPLGLGRRPDVLRSAVVVD